MVLPKDAPKDAIELTLAVDGVRPEQGFCWTFELPPEIASGDDLDNPASSALQLFEDGRPLGPGHADHHRIRLVGGGLYSHWKRQLYFSTTDNIPPTASGRRYWLRAARSGGPGEAESEAGGEAEATAERNQSLLGVLAPELRRLGKDLSLDLLAPIPVPGSLDPGSLDPGSLDPGSLEQRVDLLERKVEYLLDELYAAKSRLRHLTPHSATFRKLQDYQIGTFDFQWRHLPYHDAFLTNPAWRDKAAEDVCARLDRPPEWLRGKQVLDCGCGPGRHCWTFASLGASVTAFDASIAAVETARRETRDFAHVTIEQRSILEPLPYPAEFDLVWCYGVIHCTGDTYRALSNIASRVRPGGLLYFMVYPEPARTNGAAYRYYHEIYVLRQLTRHLSFEEKAKLFKDLQGERWALAWFDAISSEINDLYTVEELMQLLGWLGFGDVRRTMPQEHSLNVTAVRQAG